MAMKGTALKGATKTVADPSKFAASGKKVQFGAKSPMLNKTTGKDRSVKLTDNLKVKKVKPSDTRGNLKTKPVQPKKMGY